MRVLGGEPSVGPVNGDPPHRLPTVPPVGGGSLRAAELFGSERRLAGQTWSERRQGTHMDESAHLGQGAPAAISLGRGRQRNGNPRRMLAVVAAMSVLVGIGALKLSDRGSVGERLLVVDDTGTISLLDPDTGEALYEVHGATATPDRSALLTTVPVGDHTLLQSRDPVTGLVTGSTRLAGGDLTVRTVSPKGRAVALMSGPRGGGIYEPDPREHTALTVSYLDERPARTYDLVGNIEPEMFSYDETGLFVLDFVPPTAPDSYYVRRLDLATGAMSDTGAPQVGLNPKMRGKARASVLHPTGDQLFTLYTVPQTGEPVFDPAGGDEPAHAFVHVIDLKEGSSYCVFLPEPVGTVDEATVGMGISPDGDELIVVDPSTATLVRVDSSELTVMETVHVDKLRDADAQAAVAIAADGTVYVGSGPRLLELARPSLQASRAWSQDAPVSSLSVSASGDEIRVGGRVITIIDRSTGRETSVLEVPGRTVALLGPPRGSVTEFPLECAC